MAIVDTISSMYENVGEVYDTITNVDLPTNKNIENIPSTIRKSYLDIMNNGIDTIYDNWEKVNGTGTSISLNNTEEAPMTIEYKGNTSQETTTGKNLFAPKPNNSTAAGITYSLNEDGTINLSGTSTSVIYFTIDKNVSESNFVNGNTYTFSSNKTIPSGVVYKIEIRTATSWLREYYISNSTPTRTFTIDLTDAVLIRYDIQINNGTTPNLTNVGIQIEAGSSATSFEPYTNGASPNPTYPQNIHIVSGDNDIIVRGNGKNLFNKDFHIINGFFINSSGGITSDSTLSYQDYFIEVEQNTEYTISSSVSTIYRIAKYDSSKNFIDRQYNENASTSYTINTGNAKYIKMAGTLTTALDSLQIEKNSSATTYEPYIGNTYPINLPNGMELCKIGNYQDYFGKSTGKNLFDNTYNDLGMWITNIGETTTFAQGSQYLGAYCKVEPGTYTISRNKKTNRFRIGISPNQPTGTTSSCYVVASNDNASSITIDVPQGNNYICVYLSNNSETSTNVDLMIEKGSSASDYQPYGVGKWYLHKEIGKKVYEGSEYFGYGASGETGISVVNTGGIGMKQGNYLGGKSNYFMNNQSGKLVNTIRFGANDTNLWIYISSSEFSSADDFKTWVSTHNIEVYYILATPTTTEITDSTLLSQLEALNGAKSYTTQTNISQENNDMPFELDVVALSK